MSALLSQLATIAGLVVVGLVAGLVARALWAEIGPMIALLFRRTPAAEDEDGRLPR